MRNSSSGENQVVESLKPSCFLCRLKEATRSVDELMSHESPVDVASNAR